MRCSGRLRTYQETWGATSRHGSGYGLEGQVHFNQIHFNNAKYKQWKLINPITVWTHILQPFKCQRDVAVYWVNDLSDVAFVAGMLRMNWRSATTWDISNRWLAEWQKVLFHVKDIQLLHLQSQHRNQRPTAAVGSGCVLCRIPSDTNGKWRPDPRHDAPSKTHVSREVCAFHLRNREAKRELNVVWNSRPTRLSNTTTPVLSTLTELCAIKRTSRRQRWRWTREIKSSVNSRTRSGGATHRHSDPAVLPSATHLPNTPALYGYVLHTRARKLNPAIHVCCRIISGCLKPTNLDSVHLLADIAPPHIRRTVACRMERTRQTTDAIHQLFVPSPTRCWQIEDAEEFHAHSHAARLVCEQQQTAALERQPDRHVSVRQNGTAGGRVFAVWIWRGLVRLASS